MPRAGLSAEAVTDAALRLLDRDGELPTLAAVAASTGVATPSLYKHVRGLADLHRLLTTRILAELTERLRTAALGRSGPAAVTSLLHAWRDYALRYPYRYAAVPVRPVTDPDLSAAADRLVEVILAVLAGFGLTGSDAIHAARRMRAAAHGFILLEAQGGFGLPEQIEESFRRLIDMLIRDLSAAAPRARRVAR